MDPRTEAECLLETGAMYGSRVLLRGAGGPVFAGFKPSAFSLYFGDAPIYHFDLDGRWQRAFVEGTHYLKGLDTTVRAIDRVREGENLVLKRRTLGYAEASDLDARIRASAIDLLGALHDGRLDRVGPPPSARPLDEGGLLDMLDRVARRDASAWFSEREQYLAAYQGPMPLLPPDSPNPVVLQATLGHAGGIAFGAEPVSEHAARSADEFERHARAVRALLGRRVEQSKTAFLAGPDVLRQPPNLVASYLEAAARVFPIGPEAPMPRLEGIDASLDDLSDGLPGRADWARFRALHLRRVSLGIESGDAEIRATYGKTWPDEAARALVADLKAEGIGVNLLVLVDAGGAERAERHVARTAALVNALPIGPGDLVALLDGDARPAQLARLRKELAPVRAARGAKLAPYSLEKQNG